jgi:ferrous iron transport protein B
VDFALPRPLAEELHADRHHRAATLVESAMRMGPPGAQGWRYWLDEIFLHPHWGLIGSLAVFAAVLFVVFEISGWIDSMTTVKLAEAFADWQPESHRRRGRSRRARWPDRAHRHRRALHDPAGDAAGQPGTGRPDAAHRLRGRPRLPSQIGLHGGVAVPFLLGLGCNVPAISGAARLTAGRERVIAAVLITFVPCSARSAIILAIAGKYLGVAGVIGMFALILVVIALAGHLLSRRSASLARPGAGHPRLCAAGPARLAGETWHRTSDILTIVTPLLVGGSVVLALLGHVGADRAHQHPADAGDVWWLGLPLALGVPLLFGVLRKELSLLMIYQALGTQELGGVLSPVQMFVLLAFISFYVPCVSTFAVMLKTLGRRDAWFSVALSIGVACWSRVPCGLAAGGWC